MTLFIWIPKTAGTSVLNAFPGMRTFLGNYKEFDNKGDVTFGHLDAKELLKQGVISNEYWQQTYKFTVVRNPYDRFISLFKDFKRSGRIHPKMSEVRFAHTLLYVTRKPGIYNTLDFSQCASQIEWVLPGVDIKRFEDLELPTHLNRSHRRPWEKYYNSELAYLVTTLYLDDLITLNYNIL